MKYKTERMSFKELEDSVELPNFQRRLVWSQKEKKAFIETLHKGYPFGAILIYKYSDREKLSLIDGLQRYTTMKDFKKNPGKYIEFDEEVDEIIKAIDLNSLHPKTLQEVQKGINLIIQGLIENDKISKNNALYSELTTIPLVQSSLKSDSFIILGTIQDYIKDKISNFLDVSKVEIPTITFSGNENELASVFENLNRGGKKLSKYQVFAAQWSNSEVVLSDEPFNQQLLELNIERYNDLTSEREIEITNFNEKDLRESMKINFSEFCYAFGKLIIEKMPVFWTTPTEDLINEIGYSSLAITLNIENKNLSKIIDDKEIFTANFIEDYIEKVLSIYSEINNRFEKRLRMPGAKKVVYQSKNATNFQLLSFFGSLWISKYTINKENRIIETLPKYRKNYDTILNNFLGYYIYDIVTSRWSGSGDSKLDEIVIKKSNRYSTPIEKSTLETALLSWIEEKNSKYNILFDNVTKSICTIIYSFDSDQFTEQNYDFEHIVSKNFLNKIDKAKGIPGGSLGNIMLLDSNHNRSKQQLSLYENLKSGQSLDKAFLELHIYPAQDKLDAIKKEILEGNNNQNTLKRMISTRSKDLINVLINKLY
ncbi:DUF262 domain-containing protein [Exiguobacterium profundum]|uniref:DUF262 domain-containing protein n=1 Tax=Exiguobacterium TaxID=33986 RepID=UPI001BFCB167|nr:MULTISPECIES: DUF262 domain-containing protein [Exiguobacterium]MCT4797499.1 DUF262 domain-containing protein [Exiguobacterium profundum]